MMIGAQASFTGRLEVHLLQEDAIAAALPRLEAYLLQEGPLLSLSLHPGWLTVLRRSMRHVPYCLEATQGDRTRGFLALAFVRSLLFGRYLVSLPYLNYGGVQADDPAVARLLIDRAVELADQLRVRRLELRHEHPVGHPRLGHARTDKVHMRLDLPGCSEQLFRGLHSAVRSQVRKGQKNGLSVHWGRGELLGDFYSVFSRNMRDLGTPVYSRTLFAAALDQFPDRAEVCIVRDSQRPLAAALLLHGWGVTEVPSASSLRAFNRTNANMLLYYHLLERAIARGQDVFDFGRATPGSGTYRFKQQWGATPSGAEWQSYLRAGCLEETQPTNPRYQRLIRVWQRLPVALTRLIGPAIVRGIP
jgi:FemAB-related protein (PEP-CTERM system-associated)